MREREDDVATFVTINTITSGGSFIIMRLLRTSV